MDKTKCPTCGAKTVKYRHSLNKPLLMGLISISEHDGPVNLKNLNLTRNEWDNFQKLRYWYLVKKSEKAGEWEITDSGRQWLSGTIRMERTAITYRGAVEYFEGEAVSPKNIDGDFSYRQREDYAKDAVTTGAKEPDFFR